MTRFSPQKVLTKEELKESFLFALSDLVDGTTVQQIRFQKIKELLISLQEQGVYIPVFICVEDLDKHGKTPMEENTFFMNPMQDHGCLGMVLDGLLNGFPELEYIMENIQDGICEGDCENCEENCGEEDE